MTIPIEEKQLLVGCKTQDEFSAKYVAAFGKNYPPGKEMKCFYRVKNMWGRRADFLKEVEEYRQQQRTVMIPAQIKNKCNNGDARADSLPDVGETLVKIQHLMAEMVQLQKEQFELFSKIKQDRGASP